MIRISKVVVAWLLIPIGTPMLASVITNGNSCHGDIVHTNTVGGTRFGRVSVLPLDPEVYARALYGELHRSDAEGAELICVEAVPDTPQWHAITDRLSPAGS